MKKLIAVFFLFGIFFSCKTDSSVENDQKQKTESPETIEKPVNTNTIAENKPKPKAPAVFEKQVLMGNVIFGVYAENGETTKIKVTSDDLSVRKFDREFTVEGQLINAYGLDLNKDGFYELYLAIQGTDDSGNIDLIGIASYNDKSAGEITINDIEIPRKQNTDKVYAFYGELKREYYDDNNELQVYSYKLKKGEAGFILEPARTK